MDDLTIKVKNILANKYDKEFKEEWFKDGTLFKIIIKSTEEALNIKCVCEPRKLNKKYTSCKKCNKHLQMTPQILKHNNNKLKQINNEKV